MTRQRRLCAACDRALPLWARADKRACNGTCRMRVSRMRRGGRSPLSSRSYRVRQPIPRKHQSPALLQIAGVQHARAERAEQERRDWQQRCEEQAAELVQLRRELAEQKHSAAVQRRDHEAKMEELRGELTEKSSAAEAELAEAKERLEEITEERDVLQELLTESDASLDELRQEVKERESEEESEKEELRRQSNETSRLVKECEALRSWLAQTERAHKEVSEVADSQRRTIRYEQQRRTELEKQLDQALKAPKTPPKEHDRGMTETAWAAHLRAEQLAVENQRLRMHRDAVAHERERISNRILRMMSPGQYLDHAASAGYDPTKDPLIERKIDELRVLDRYSRWQRKYMQRVTARRLKEERPIDEQAIEAALADRWKLMTKPLKKLGKQPEWRIVGFLLDDESELFLAKESRDRANKMVQRMDG